MIKKRETEGIKKKLEVEIELCFSNDAFSIVALT